jgi:hypothetical protein
VQRYLKDEPVQACPPSLGYRLRKLVRRHKGLVLAAALLVLVLLGGIIGTTWGMLRATDAEADAILEAGQKEGAFKAAQASARDAQEQLSLALRNQARAERVSGRPGQRHQQFHQMLGALQVILTGRRAREEARQHRLADVHGVEDAIELAVL